MKTQEPWGAGPHGGIGRGRGGGRPDDGGAHWGNQGKRTLSTTDKFFLLFSFRPTAEKPASSWRETRGKGGWGGRRRLTARQSSLLRTTPPGLSTSTTCQSWLLKKKIAQFSFLKSFFLQATFFCNPEGLQLRRYVVKFFT